MGNELDVRAGRHVVYALHVYLVFVTKFRHAVFTAAHVAQLESCVMCVLTVSASWLSSTPDTDHVHLLVNSLKAVSSRYLRRKFPELERAYWRAKHCGPAPTSQVLLVEHPSAC